ncbi:MAG: hypothetical protein M0R20_01750 [Candidatus Omnitrophica bacterium]|jgi:hypothetical protein|nr:hypothetical protein [Candidatus Omnitrophota bacterium]
MKKSKDKKKGRTFKKSIKHFIKDEDGFIEKEKIIKIGLGTISALTVVGSLTAPKQAYAEHTDSPAGKYMDEEAVPGTTCSRLVVRDHTHGNHDSGK